MDIIGGRGSKAYGRTIPMQPWKIAAMFDNSVLVNQELVAYLYSRYAADDILDVHFGRTIKFPNISNDLFREFMKKCENGYHDVFQEMWHPSSANYLDDTPYSFREIVKLAQYLYGSELTRNRDFAWCIWNVDIARIREGLLRYTTDTLAFRDKYYRWKYQIQIYESGSFTETKELKDKLWKPAFRNPLMYQIYIRGNLVWMFGDLDPDSKMMIYFVPDELLDMRYQRREDAIQDVLEKSSDNIPN